MYRANVAFPAGQGLVGGGYRRSDPVVYRVDGTVPKPPDGLGPHCENFERVDTDELFARGEDPVRTAGRSSSPD